MVSDSSRCNGVAVVVGAAHHGDYIGCLRLDGNQGGVGEVAADDRELVHGPAREEAVADAGVQEGVALRGQLEGRGAGLLAAPEELETEAIIARVASGEYDLTLADSHIVDIEGTWRSDIRAALTIGEPVDLGWAVRTDNPELLAAVDHLDGEAVRVGETHALAAARALMQHSSLGAAEMVRASLQIAAEICENGPLAVAAVLRTLRETNGMRETEALEHEFTYGWDVFGSEDAKEGPTAFMERRKPSFTGE